MIGILSILYQALCFSDYDWELPSDKLSVEVMSHSFSAPFKYASSFPNWMISGSSMYVRDTRSGVILNPAIPARHGFLWNRKALSSSNFDMTLTLYMDEGRSEGGERPLPSLDQTISLWFSRRNVSSVFQKAMQDLAAFDADWTEHMKKNSFDPATGGPLEFEGIRVTVSLIEGKDRRRPSVTLTVGGEKKRSFLLSSDEYKGRLMYLRLRLSVREKTVSFLVQDRGEWTSRLVIADIGPGIVPSEGYIGVTSFSGVKSKEGVSSQIRIASLHVKSFNLTALNTSENKEVLALFESEKLPVETLLNDESYKDQISQTEVVLKLSKIMHKYMKSTIPDLSQFRSNITALQKDLVALEEFVSTLTKEARYTFTQSGGGASKISALMGEIRSIHATISEADSHRESLVNGISKVREAAPGSDPNRYFAHYERQANERNAELASTIAVNNRMSFIFFFILVTAALAMGILFYRKLNKYARKAHMF